MFKRKSHLPTSNFQGICYFSEGNYQKPCPPCHFPTVFFCCDLGGKLGQRWLEN